MTDDTDGATEDLSTDAADPDAPTDQESVGRTGRWRQRYEGSAVQDFFHRLGTVNFGDQIILFGAALLLSVLPLVILLSAYASHRVDNDIVGHLGLDNQGARIVEGLFRSDNVSFNLGIMVSLLLGIAGTVAVARSVQLIYEKSFEQPEARGAGKWVRCFVWVLVVGGVVMGEATLGRTLRDEPAGRLVLGVVELVALTVFFWWSVHFLLGGRVGWRRAFPAALATSLFWIGLGVFASLYFSSTIVSDSHLYGTIGVVFTLVTWFIAMGAVIALGAVAGVTWERRRARRKGTEPAA
jgi:membrane protein